MGDVAGVQEDVVAEWHALLRRHAAVFTALEAALHEHGLGVSEFEALELLAGCEHNKCRGADLTDAVQLTQSAASRLVARMERAGLVERAMCEMDRRGIFVMLTDEGRRRYEAAKPAHRAVLAETLGDPA